MIGIVFATRNANKLKELVALLGDLPVRWRSLADFPSAPEVEESGTTFAANAVLKALSAHAHTGLPALADDSGLCVVALDGAPGVHSARYAGPQGDARRNNEKLLHALADRVAPAERRAFFAAALVLAAPRAFLGPDRLPADLRPSGLAEATGLALFEGRAHGSLLHAPRGQSGFGYDPLFLSDEGGASFAELPADVKNRISHRARAVAGLREFLTRCIPTAA